MKTLESQPNNNNAPSYNMISQSKSPFFTPNRIGFSLSLIAHLAFALMFYDYFHNIDVQQNGDEITSIALATFQTPSNEPVVEPPKPQPIVKPKKKHHRKEIVKEHGKLAKKEEEVVPPTPTPQAKPDEKVEEGEMIQTLSYRNGEEDEVFAKIKRAIERRNKYPNMAKKRGLEGEVIVEFIIYKDGKVSNIRIVKPCPHESFNTAAINAVRKAQGDFPSLDVTTKIELPIVYELKMSKL